MSVEVQWQCRICLTCFNLFKYAHLHWNLPAQTWQEKKKPKSFGKWKGMKKTCLSGGALLFCSEYISLLLYTTDSSVPTPSIATVTAAPSFFKLFRFFFCWLWHIHYHINFHAISKYLASSSPKHFLFYSECPSSQFGHKPSETSHLNSGIQILAINFTLNELTQTCN